MTRSGSGSWLVSNRSALPWPMMEVWLMPERPSLPVLLMGSWLTGDRWAFLLFCAEGQVASEELVQHHSHRPEISRGSVDPDSIFTVGICTLELQLK